MLLLLLQMITPIIHKLLLTLNKIKKLISRFKNRNFYIKSIIGDIKDFSIKKILKLKIIKKILCKILIIYL